MKSKVCFLNYRYLLLMIISTLVLSPKSMADSYLCRKNGTIITEAELNTTGGVIQNESMAKLLSGYGYEEYVELTNKVKERMPVFGKALENITKIRWVSIKDFSCDLKRSEMNSWIGPVDGLRQAILYQNNGSNFEKFILSKEFYSTNFNSPSNKKRVMALINEAERYYFKNTHDSFAFSQSAAIIYKMFEPSTNEGEFQNLHKNLTSIMNSMRGYELPLLKFEIENRIENLSNLADLITEYTKIVKKDMQDVATELATKSGFPPGNIDYDVDPRKRTLSIFVRTKKLFSRPFSNDDYNYYKISYHVTDEKITDSTRSLFERLRDIMAEEQKFSSTYETVPGLMRCTLYDFSKKWDDIKCYKEKLEHYKKLLK